MGRADYAAPSKRSLIIESKLMRAEFRKVKTLTRVREAVLHIGSVVASSQETIKRSIELLRSTADFWPPRSTPSYEELSRADWLPALRFAIGARRPDGSDLSPHDQAILARIARQLDQVAEREGLVAAAAAHDEVINILASPDGGATLH